MKRAITAAALTAFLLPAIAASAPKAQHPQECAWYWDIAITARAQAMEGVERETARRAIWRIFNSPLKRMHKIGNAVVDAVYRMPWSADEPAGLLAKKIRDACLATGDMDGVLGKDS